MIDPDDDEPEIFPISYSTAYLCIAALATIRTNEDELFDSEVVSYVRRIMEIVKAQPDTVLTLPPSELEEMGPLLLNNAATWLEKQ